jgi:hypothetical protein
MYLFMHNILSQTIGGSDKCRILKTGFRIDAEHYPAAGQIGPYHLLYGNTERDGKMVKVLVLTIRNRPVGEQ